MTIIEVGGSRLEVATWGAGRTPLVLLHDGVGSITQWREVPELLAEQGDVTVVVYNRAGHGLSTPVPDGPWPLDWISRESDVLAGLVDELDMDRPILVGHSDGGSIALLATARGQVDTAGVLALAPHSYVEECCVTAIEELRRDPGELLERLGRHHADPEAVFEAWSGAWTDPGFRTWDIRPQLADVAVPTLVLQGSADDYGTDAMLWDTAAAIGPNAEARLLPGIGHRIHREVPDVVVDAILEFVAALPLEIGDETHT
jgi:pimeloyl-ACP methyl ester carboxylesterase